MRDLWQWKSGDDNEFVAWEAIDSLKVKSAELKDNFFSWLSVFLCCWERPQFVMSFVMADTSRGGFLQLRTTNVVTEVSLYVEYASFVTVGGVLKNKTKKQDFVCG